MEVNIFSQRGTGRFQCDMKCKTLWLQIGKDPQTVSEQN